MRGMEVGIELVNYCEEAYIEEAKVDNEKDSSLKLTQWAQMGDIYSPTNKTIKKLPAGYYMVYTTNGRRFFEKRDLETDSLINFPGSMLDDVYQEIKSFWDKNEVFEKYGFLHRRGYMFTGPAGSGKTCFVQMVIEKLIAEDGIVINGSINPRALSESIKELRVIEPKRKIVCIFEDIDAIVHSFGEEDLLAFLDGETLTNHVLNIATTNYPEKLDHRIIHRPRRFDRVIVVDMPKEEMRTTYFKEKLQIEDEEIKKYVDITDGFSFAAMAELVIMVKCFEHDLETAANEISKQLKTKFNSKEYYCDSLGFKD